MESCDRAVHFHKLLPARFQGGKPQAPHQIQKPHKRILALGHHRRADAQCAQEEHYGQADLHFIRQ